MTTLIHYVRVADIVPIIVNIITKMHIISYINPRTE